VHPGVVASEFAGSDDTSGLLALMVKATRWAFLTPEKGARTSVHVASAPELEGVSGKYFMRSKVARSSRTAQDRGAALRLWEVSEQLTGANAV